VTGSIFCSLHKTNPVTLFSQVSNIVNVDSPKQYHIKIQSSGIENFKVVDTTGLPSIYGCYSPFSALASLKRHHHFYP
jgi:hypothetical protein